MKGVVFLGDKKLEIQNFEDPSPGPNDVIIEIKASGMCGSDLKFYRANSGPSSLGLAGVSNLQRRSCFSEQRSQPCCSPSSCKAVRRLSGWCEDSPSRRTQRQA